MAEEEKIADKSRWVFIENEGALFRGPSRAWPEEIYHDGKWHPYAGRSDKPRGIAWGDVISAEEFKRLAALDD